MTLMLIILSCFVRRFQLDPCVSVETLLIFAQFLRGD